MNPWPKRLTTGNGLDACTLHGRAQASNSKKQKFYHGQPDMDYPRFLIPGAGSARKGLT
jgi:hypothetical protein